MPDKLSANEIALSAGEFTLLSAAAVEQLKSSASTRTEHSHSHWHTHSYSHVHSYLYSSIRNHNTLTAASSFARAMNGEEGGGGGKCNEMQFILPTWQDTPLHEWQP